MKDQSYNYKRAGVFAVIFFVVIIISGALNDVSTVSNFMATHPVAEYVFAAGMVVIWCLFAYYFVRYLILRVKYLRWKLKQWRTDRK